MSLVFADSTRTVTRLGPCLALLLLTGCQSSMGPMSWTTGYRQVMPTSGASAPRAATIVPNLCQTQPDETGLVTLPPGCANDLNLQLMVVEPQDLIRGREMGPALAAPVADAANEHVHGRERARQRRQLLEQEARNAMENNATTSDL